VTSQFQKDIQRAIASALVSIDTATFSTYESSPVGDDEIEVYAETAVGQFGVRLKITEVWGID
jgi:hypothetical protein